MPMLDTLNLVFLHPPHNIPLSEFESPISPIINSRVCDDCWDQLHSCPSTPHTPDVVRSAFKHLLSNPISCTVAQKTAQVFACFQKIALLWDDDVIQGPEIFTQENTTS